MTLSKEFFQVIKKALKGSSWRRDEFAMVEAVERELNMLYDHQTRQLNPMYMSASLEPDQKTTPIVVTPPIKYTPAPAPIIPSTESTGFAQASEDKVKKTTRKKNNSVAEVSKVNGNPAGMSASPAGMEGIDAMIMAGMEMAKTAPALEKRLLSHVVVEQMPETQSDYENAPIV